MNNGWELNETVTGFTLDGKSVKQSEDQRTSVDAETETLGQKGDQTVPRLLSFPSKNTSETAAGKSTERKTAAVSKSVEWVLPGQSNMKSVLKRKDRRTSDR